VSESPLPRLRGDWQASELPPGYTYLVFRAYDGVAVDVGGRRIYDVPGARGKLAVHVVPVPPGGGRLIVSTPSDLLGDDAVLATQATLPSAIRDVTLGPVRENATDIVLAVVFVAAGIIALLASALRRRAGSLTIAAVGAFTVLYGARLLANSALPLLLGFSVRSALFAVAWLTYVIPVPGWFAAKQLLGEGWRSTLRLQVYAFAAFAPIAILSDIVRGRPETMEQVNNVLVIAGGLNILFNVLRGPRRATAELRVVLAGAIVFLLFALENNLGALGLLPWRASLEPAGFLAFIGALGYASTRAVVRNEREQLALQHELRTAREIQQSILPRTMPEVQGLRFATAYEPATSVAGDLYDFLRVDGQHAGLLVADVAGHGVPAALIASMVKVAASSQSRLAHDPAALLTALNDTLRDEVRRAFVTATFLWFDMERHTVSVCNAGHPPPLLYRDGAFTELGSHGVLLGRFAGARYETAVVELREGDRVAAFTDGIVEARNARDEQFGEERLQQSIARAGVSETIAAVHQWCVADDADDLTIVTIDVTGSPARTRGPARP
jgi:sigma-B regulation protein RsbU (phosphoserine phosphatase)